MIMAIAIYIKGKKDLSKLRLTLQQLLEQAMSETGATSQRDMGKVMGWLKPKIQGRADMGSISSAVKQHLSA